MCIYTYMHPRIKAKYSYIKEPREKIAAVHNIHLSHSKVPLPPPPKYNNPNYWPQQGAESCIRHALHRPLTPSEAPLKVATRQAGRRGKDG